MIEEKEIDLDNPIFAYYINVDGLSRQSVDEQIQKIS